MTDTDETASRLRDAVIDRGWQYKPWLSVRSGGKEFRAALDAYRDHIALVARRDALREIGCRHGLTGIERLPYCAHPANIVRWDTSSQDVPCMPCRLRTEAERMLDTEKPAEAGRTVV